MCCDWPNNAIASAMTRPLEIDNEILGLFTGRAAIDPLWRLTISHIIEKTMQFLRDSKINRHTCWRIAHEALEKPMDLKGDQYVYENAGAEIFS